VNHHWSVTKLSHVSSFTAFSYFIGRDCSKPQSLVPSCKCIYLIVIIFEFLHLGSDELAFRLTLEWNLLVCNL
jgi:hypothetical protein